MSKGAVVSCVSLIAAMARGSDNSSNGSKTFTVTLSPANETPPCTVAAAGAPSDFATFVTALKAGGAGYVNVHTAACSAGEIRAEIQ